MKFQWSSPSFSLVMRVTAVTPPSGTQTDWQLELIEDQFALGVRTIGEPGETEHLDPGAALDTAPPSASWDTAANPPDGLAQIVLELNTGAFTNFIDGRFIFGSYAPGGQYARLWVTEPGGIQTLAPPQYPPDDDNKGSFQWPATVTGTYEFCLQTFSLHGATNDVKVCADITITTLTADNVRQLEDGITRHLEDGTVRILE